MTAERTVAAPARTSGLRSKAAAYLALTKPRIVELLLTTTVPTMILAARGWPGAGLVIGVLVGGALAAGGANAFNCYLDRDIDRLMHRTSRRPLVTGAVTDREALGFAWILSISSIALLALVANLLTAALTLAAILLYVVFYTMVLKRRTDQNIVWGGAAGCMPVVIGWASVTGSLDWPALVLFLVIFLWTPAHYWPLSVRYADDYARARVPMLSVTEGAGSVALQAVLYAWATTVMSLLLVPVAAMGLVYTVIAAGAGAWFIAEAHVLYYHTVRRDGLGRPMRVFHLSITYLTLLFVAIGVDPFVAPLLAAR